MATAKKPAATTRKAAPKKEVAPQEDNEIILDIGDDMIDAGFEGTDETSYAIPFLTVIQPQSPQVVPEDPAYIEDAKAGMLFNTVTQELYDGKTGVIIMPCAYQRRFICWGPKGSDGFKGEYLPERVAEMQEAGEIVSYENGLYIPLEDGSVHEKKCDRMVDTRNHFVCIVNEDGSSSTAILSLRSTQIKKSKSLMSLLRSIKVKIRTGRKVTPPTWYNKVRLTTVGESNDDGNWYGVKFVTEGIETDADLIDQCKDFHKIVAAGEANVKYDDAEPKEDKGEGDF